MKFLNKLERINFDCQHIVGENVANEVFKVLQRIKIFPKLFLTL
jgi:hypothetical protein